MTQVFIAIGSNLSDPVQQAQQGIEALKHVPQTEFVTTSSLYSSTPMGPQDQPDYINAVVQVETDLSPLALLDHTQRIELEHGRVRKAERWGPRTLDLDILLFGDQWIESERLTIPHYDMTSRAFVLCPLAEIAPDLIFPDGTSLQYYFNQVDRTGLHVWSPTSEKALR